MAFTIFLSGCIDPGRTTTEIVSKDMLKIKSIEIFPSKDVQPDDTIIVRMEIENAGQESTYLLVDKNANTRGTTSEPNTDWNGDALLIDHCQSLYRADRADEIEADFQILSGGSCTPFSSMYGAQDIQDKNYENPLIPLVKDSSGNPIGAVLDTAGEISVFGTDEKPVAACYLKMPPGQSHTFQWSVKAPSNDKIAGMANKCTFKFQMAYAAAAVTNTYVYFADPLEVAQRLYTQKDMTQVGDNIASYGPVAVNFVPAEPQPIPARKNDDWTVFLNLKNVGEGIANVNYIAMNTGSMKKANPGLMSSGCRMITDIEQDIELVDAMKEYQSYLVDVKKYVGADKDSDLTSALFNFKSCDEKEFAACTSQLTQLAKEYHEQYCSKSKDDKCAKKLSEIETLLKKELEDAKRQLQIYAGQSSRIPCELTTPNGVTILTPFRFVTTADYTYSIRHDIQITTKPIRERA